MWGNLAAGFERVHRCPSGAGWKSQRDTLTERGVSTAHEWIQSTYLLTSFGKPTQVSRCFSSETLTLLVRSPVRSRAAVFNEAAATGLSSLISQIYNLYILIIAFSAGINWGHWLTHWVNWKGAQRRYNWPIWLQSWSAALVPLFHSSLPDLMKVVFVLWFLNQPHLPISAAEIKICSCRSVHYYAIGFLVFSWV